MTHPKTIKLKILTTVAALCFSATSVASQGVLVNEPGVRSNTGATANAMTNVNTQTIMTRQAIQETQAAIGSAGPSGSPLTGAIGNAIGTGSDFYQNMQRFAYDMCAVTLCENSDPQGSTDIEDVREWAMENFYADDILDEPTRRDLLEIRRRGQVYANVNALSLAVTIHNDLAGADGTANALEEKIAQAGNMRADIQANSTILLAQYKVMLQELAVMNASLAVLATNGIAGADIYHEEGGTSFADALNDDDFSDAGFSVRTRVTPPDRGAAGALSILP